MKLPRGVSADRLIRAVEILGNKRARQKGSHLGLIHPGAACPFDLYSPSQSLENWNIPEHSRRCCQSPVDPDEEHRQPSLEAGVLSRKFGKSGYSSADGTHP